MQRVSNLFNAEQRQRIEKAVWEAESKTKCEIVPVVANISGRYDRPEDIIGLWLATLAAVLVWLLFPQQLYESGSWDYTPIYVGVITMCASILIAFIVGAVVGSRVGWLRRLFTPHKQMMEEVSSRAKAIFFDKRIHHTSSATGLLIYVSLFEHVAVVLGDQTVLEKLGQEAIDRLCQQLTQGLRQGNATEAICNVIEEAGRLLAGPLPRGQGDSNELQNSLILIDD